MDTVLNTAKIIGIAVAQLLVILYCIRKYYNDAKERIDISSGVKSQNKIDLDLISKMDYYKEILNADHILLFEFHNGQHYSNYRSALRMSVSYEVYKAGLESIRDKCSFLPIAIMPKFIEAITENGKAYCKDIEEIKNDMGNSYEFKKSMGIGSFYDVAIKDREGHIIGFVAVQWNKPFKGEFDVDNIEKLVWYVEECVNRLMESDRQLKKKHSIFKRR